MRSISAFWPGPKRLVRIEAPDAFEQALPAQDFVAAGNDAVKIVGDVEDGGIAVGHLRVERQQIGRRSIAFGDRRMNAVQAVRPPSSPTRSSGRAGRP